MSHNFNSSFIEEVETEASTQPIRAQDYHSHTADIALFKGAKSKEAALEQVPFKLVKNYNMEVMKK